MSYQERVNLVLLLELGERRAVRDCSRMKNHRRRSLLLWTLCSGGRQNAQGPGFSDCLCPAVDTEFAVQIAGVRFDCVE